MTPVSVLVPVTFENFDPAAYLQANPDVAKAGVDPRKHFRKFGHREGRRQLNPDFQSAGAEMRRCKFARFKPYLDLEPGADTFPVSVGRHYDLSEYQTEGANGDFGPFVQEVAAHPGLLYLDLGCGFRHTVYENCLYLEVYPSLTADLVVTPNTAYPIQDGTFDGIGCFAVLEHTRRPWELVQEIRRMLKPGGQVWIDWPFLQPVHGYPSHYFNATREGLRTTFEDAGFVLKSIDTWHFQGLDHTITWAMNELMRNLPPAARKRVGKMRVSDLLAHRPEDEFWRALVSLVDNATRERLACGNTLIATLP
jgi:SAM-dependent methyltransferase